MLCRFINGFLRDSTHISDISYSYWNDPYKSTALLLRVIRKAASAAVWSYHNTHSFFAVQSCAWKTNIETWTSTADFVGDMFGRANVHHTVCHRCVLHCYRYYSLLRPGTGADYCDQPVCLYVSLSVCVCLSASISLNHWTDLHKIFCADPLWPWLGPPVAALWYVMYFRFYGWRHVWP